MYWRWEQEDICCKEYQTKFVQKQILATRDIHGLQKWHLNFDMLW